MSEYRDFLNEQMKESAFRRAYTKLWPTYILKQAAIILGIAARRIRCRICCVLRRKVPK